jgi:hypothetical protein
MPDIQKRLLKIAKSVSKKLNNDFEVEAEADHDQQKSYQGSWAALGRTCDGISIVIFAGLYFRDSKGVRSLQFWAGLEAEPKQESLLKRFAASFSPEPVKEIRVKDYCDPDALWLPTEEQDRWFRPHLDLSERQNYSWFGRFFSGEFADKRLEQDILRFLTLIKTKKRTNQLS